MEARKTGGNPGTANKTDERVYVTGANGRLGQAFISIMPEAVPLVRNPAKGVPGSSRVVVTNFSEEQLKQILKDAVAVVHLAGSIDTLNKAKLLESNVELTRRIVNAAPENCKIVFASSIAVYGKHIATLPANEKTPPNPDSDYSNSKYDAEKLVATHKHAILRIGTLYGPQFDDYNLVLSMIERKKMKVIGEGSNHIPFVHVDDVANAIKHAVKDGNGTYILVGEQLTQNEVYRLAAKELNAEIPKNKVSKQLALFVAHAGEFAHKFGAKRPKISVEHASVLAYDRTFDCSKAAKELDFVPRPLSDGIREVVDHYRIVGTNQRLGKTHKSY